MPEVRLHGREEEQRRIAGLLDRAEHDAPRVLVVSGQTGIGKTRLLSEAARHARQRGLTVHHPRTGDLRALLPGHRPHSPGDRALLVLDDVAALTAGELHTLLRTVRQEPAPSPTLLLARAATAQAVPCAAAGARVDVLELSPLTGGAVRGLVRDLIGVPPTAGLLDVVNCAHGNPRLIVELVEGLAEEGRIGPGGELIRLTPRQLPARVRAAVDEHLRQLSKESVQLLRVGTILGRTFPLSQAAAMLGTGTAALLPALDETVAAGLLTFADDGVSFQQPLVWRSVYESIPAAVRDALHQEARRCAARPGAAAHDPSGLGPADPGPAELGLAELGRREGARERHGAVLPGGAGTTGAIRTLLRTGHTESVVLLVRSALNRRLPAPEELVLRGLMADFVLAGGHAGAAFAADRTGPAAGSVPLADAWADAVIDQLAGAGPEAARTAAVVLSGLEWAEGRTAEAVRWGRLAVDQPLPPVPPAGGAYPRLALAAKLVALGDLDEARDLLGRVPAEKDDAVFGLAAELVRAAAALRAGEPDAARRRARGVRSAAADGGLPGLAAWASATLCRADLLAGDTGSAAGHLARCREHRAALEAVPHLALRCHWLDVLLHAARNEVREAAGLLAAAPVPLPSSRPLLLAEPGAAAWFVRFSRRAGDPALADTALRTVERLAADNPDAPAVRLAALHARSLYECDPDGIARVAAEHPDAWTRACAAQDLTELLNERQVPPDARPQLAPSRPTGTWTTRDHVGRMTLVDATAHQRQPAPPRPAEPLTDMEHTIAGLVARGLTNRQVAQRVHLSPHTVNYHLRRIYGKLDIRSRVALARYVHDHGLEPGGAALRTH
ncbi:helix-turn-helix transcriptional regulator [Streptomyces fumanus]|uniref:Helix-turn-helix transcriptional regulator n=1 Tax=Streptomyces fumanus TaxID=67302 RepID=A0A919ABW6_9ACTN|nr:LuxR family transcriptional regulator [Streptomyces fumanus]GHE95997.1 helix-turn-helix transcriptional regulator [Streptomyces fumanus]